MDTKNDKTYFELSDAEKKRIIQKAARDGAEMQKETWAKAIRKQAITDAIEALKPPDIRPSLEVRKESEYVDGRCSEMTYLDDRIAALKEREGI